MAVTVLIIDDSQGVRDTFPALLRLEGFHAMTAGDGSSGIAMALANPFDVILVDHHLPDISGIDVVKELKRQGVPAPIVVCDVDYGVSSMQLRERRIAVPFYSAPERRGCCELAPFGRIWSI